MPLEHLLGALERDARAQAEALLAEAWTAAAAVARAADERRDRQRGAVLAARDAELRGAAEAALGEARRAARREWLEARERLLARVFAEARAMFPEAVAGRAYRATLADQLAAALGAVGEEPAVIRCPEALGPAVRAAVGRRRGCTVQADPAAAPGLTVVTTDGAITVDATLEGRLERARPRLALEVFALLGRPA